MSAASGTLLVIRRNRKLRIGAIEIRAVMAHWRYVLPQDAMLEVQYEDVVADLETQARRILVYCGLSWDDACLAFHKTKRPVRAASAAQVRQPLYRSPVGRWRAYGDELKPLLEALGLPAPESDEDGNWITVREVSRE